MLKALIFDMDGVLIDSIGAIKEVFSMYIKKHNIDLTEEDFEAVKGMSLRDKLMIWGNKIKLPGGDIYDLFSKISQELFQMEKGLLKDKLHPDPDVIHLIQSAKAKAIKIGVATMSARPRAEVILKKIGIRNLIDTLVTVEDIKKHRPDPEALQLAASLLKIEPKNCIAFDDASIGMGAAKKAGMIAVGVTRNKSPEEFVNADLTIKDLSEIKLEKLFQLFKP